jgi:hypothetical protein
MTYCATIDSIVIFQDWPPRDNFDKLFPELFVASKDAVSSVERVILTTYEFSISPRILFMDSVVMTMYQFRRAKHDGIELDSATEKKFRSAYHY